MKTFCMIIFLTTLNLYSQEAKVINRISTQIQGFKDYYSVLATWQTGLMSSLQVSFAHFTKKKVLTSYKTYELDVMYSKSARINRFYFSGATGLFVSRTKIKRKTKSLSSEIENGIPLSFTVEYYLASRLAAVFSLKSLFFIKSSNYNQKILSGIGVRFGL